MRTWTRASGYAQCGRCAEPIASGEPIQRLTLAHVTRELVRCERCADGPVPPDLSAGIVPGRRTKRMTPIRQLATRADWKARQAGT